jgi:hypothetical protein
MMDGVGRCTTSKRSSGMKATEQPSGTHLPPDAHDKVVQSWARRHKASVTYGRKLRTPFIGRPCWWAVLDLNQ